MFTERLMSQTNVCDSSAAWSITRRSCTKTYPEPLSESNLHDKPFVVTTRCLYDPERCSST